MKFWIKTLGCKVNQVESSYVFERLKKAGLDPAKSEEEAELFILNSCAVTERACLEAKKILRHWKKLNPKGVIFTGCSAQVQAEEFRKIAEALGLTPFIILGQKEKYEPERYLKDLSEKTPLIKVDSSLETCYPLLLEEFHGHSRAFVKIQDGCSSFCSYCIVPYSRGPSRSLSEEHILTQIRRFLEQGYQEIVLTGIHLGLWGEDLQPRRKLTDLLFKIENLFKSYQKPLNLRLSSLEVNEIDEDFLGFARESQFLCPHFHIPLQSGSNLILQRMNRKYRAETYLERVKTLHKLFPSATLGADVLVGFPGEGEREFLDTYELIEKSPLNWLHIFPFSERPGTPAEALTPKVPPEEKKRRVAALKKLSHQKKRAFLERNLGTLRKAILEEEKGDSVKALTDNYLQVILLRDRVPYASKGGLIMVKLLRLRGDLLEAEPFEDKEIVKT
jgi:threonylcarbamoyladenosine tRNA methylthiotransferase MtaB